MKKLTATHVIDCDVETYWKVFFDAEYNKKLYLEGLSFKQFEILEQSETKRRMRGVPKMNLPGPVAKLLGDSFGYEEQGSFEKDANTFRWKMLPNTMADKLSTSGFTRVEATSDGKTKRYNEASIEAKVFGVGGLLEGTAEKEVRDSWEKEAVFMNRWVAGQKK